VEGRLLARFLPLTLVFKSQGKQEGKFVVRAQVGFHMTDPFVGRGSMWAGHFLMDGKQASFAPKRVERQATEVADQIHMYSKAWEVESKLEV